MCQFACITIAYILDLNDSSLYHHGVLPCKAIKFHEIGGLNGTEIPISDISMRFSCQISRRKGYLKVNVSLFFA